MKTLTVQDLRQTLRDSRHLGFGWATSEYMDDQHLVEECERVIVERANKLGLDYEDLFAWSNSKLGRWFVDGVHGCDEDPQDTVDKLFTARELATIGVHVKTGDAHGN